MAIQEPAVNGTNVVAGDPVTGVALRNVHLRAPQTSDYVQPGSKRAVVRDGQRVACRLDRLVSITSDVGSVAITGDATCVPSAPSSSARPTVSPATGCERDT